MIEKVSVTTEVPKESKELVDGAAALIKHFLSGKSIAEASELLGPMYAAAEGANKVGAELGSDGNDEVAGYTVQKILEALKTKKAPVAI